MIQCYNSKCPYKDQITGDCTVTACMQSVNTIIESNRIEFPRTIGDTTFYTNDELSKLQELRQVQKQIEDTQKAIIINYKIFDDMITNKFDLTLELLTAVSEDRGTMRAFNSDSNSKLKELIGILLAFQNEISKSEFNQDLLKSLKNQEMQLKNDLGIK